MQNNDRKHALYLLIPYIVPFLAVEDRLNFLSTCKYFQKERIRSIQLGRVEIPELASCVKTFLATCGSIAKSIRHMDLVYDRDDDGPCAFDCLFQLLTNLETVSAGAVTDIALLMPIKDSLQSLKLCPIALEIKIIQNIVLLKHLPHLKSLHFDYCDIDTFEFVSTLTQLTEFTLRNRPETHFSVDLRVFSHLNLSKLTLNNDPNVTNWELLSFHSSLTLLDLNGTQISDITCLEALKNLEMLNLSATRITNLNSLKELSQIKYLLMSSNNISSLDPLCGWKELRVFACSNTKIQSLDPISACSLMERIEFAKTLVKSVAALAGMKKLKRVTLHKTPITSLEPIYGHLSINRLDCDVRLMQEKKRVFSRKS
ncbi:UNVERIFIED_CONTAM: hypothetical protein HDU68_012581 [Siphonaria sp. JEL0065]|nr:hypothetical protein HDU68_012581 [Siphonaria sp. JEL0065]